MYEYELRNAAVEGDLRGIKALIAKGADVNAKWVDSTALMWAAENGQLECLKALIEGGADVNVQQEKYSRYTALICAAEKGHAECVKALIAAGADMNVRDKYESTALMHAVDHYRNDCVEALIDGGADLNVKGPFGKTLSETFLEKAIKSNDLRRFRALIAKGADVNARSGWCQTALAEAAKKGKTEFVMALIDGGADLKGENNIGSAALMYAAEKGHTECVKALIDGGADVNVRESDTSRESALMKAARGGHVECVNALIVAGANVNYQDKWGNTVLQRASPAVKGILQAAGAERKIRFCEKSFGLGPAAGVWVAFAFGIAALMHWLSPLLPIWGAGLLGIASVPFIAFFVNTCADLADSPKDLLFLLAVLAVGVAALTHWLSPWFPTWAAAGLFGTLTASIIWPLPALLLARLMPKLPPLPSPGQMGRVTGIASVWAVVAFGIAVLIHQLSPSLPTWGAGLGGIVSALFFAFFVAVLVGYTKYSAYRKIMLFAWVILAFGLAASLHWLSPWFPTLEAAGVFGVLVAFIFCPLALLLPEPALRSVDPLGTNCSKCGKQLGLGGIGGTGMFFGKKGFDALFELTKASGSFACGSCGAPFCMGCILKMRAGNRPCPVCGRSHGW